MVRSAPNAESGYPFGMLGKGAKVRVVQEDLGWARVSTGGESFREWFGFVVASPGVALSADGRSLKVSSRAEIRAPRADANWAPDASWKPIGFLVSGDEITVLESVQGERDVFYKVALTEKSSGWIPLSALSRANPAPASIPAEVDTETGGSALPQNDPADAGSAEYAQDGATKPGDAAATQPDASAKPSTDAEARTQAVAKARRVRLSDLEAIFKKLQKESMESAEYVQLKDRVLAIADEAASKMEASNARTLAEQIDIRIEAQDALARIAEAKRRREADVKAIADLRLADEARRGYDAVGRINASAVYNGERLPLLYRLQDPVTGQTISYIVPGPSFELGPMLGLLVGVKGPTRFDESLRLNVVTPNSIAILNQSSTPAPAPVTATVTEKPTAEEK